ncbi:MAG: exo-alpha-sialidase, partial [Clostridia bacterium]|nr:exo-alpha-sialidase [Clostridia bacterium]
RRLFDGLMLNKPIAASTGEWYFPVGLWSRAVIRPLEEHPELDARRLSGVYVTADGGDRFEWRGGADVPGRGFDEHMLVELKDGRLWLLVRASYGIGQAFSSDGGRTWTGGGPSGHSGPNARFFIRRLASGRLLLVNHVNPTYTTNPKNWNVRNNLMAMLSEDDGKTWIGGLMLDTRNEISYPDGTQAANGDIYLIYDYSRYSARQILMAVFNEDDILAGRLVSPNARLKQLVSRATGPIPEK